MGPVPLSFGATYSEVMSRYKESTCRGNIPVGAKYRYEKTAKEFCAAIEIKTARRVCI